jgi:hypothetical protein
MIGSSLTSISEVCSQRRNTMPEEKKKENDADECRVTVQVEGCGACCGMGTGDLNTDGKQRVIKVVCCPPDEKKEQ